jgi:hypothetical protein
MATNSNVNNCKTSCCVFNFYTQTVYNPNPPRLWSRFNYVCPCYPTNPCLLSLSSWTQSVDKTSDSFICLSSSDDCTKAIAGGKLFTGILYSTNGGKNWSQSTGGSGVTAGAILSLSSSSNGGNIAIAGILGLGLWYSSDGGQSWAQSNEGFPKSFSFTSISSDGSKAIAGSPLVGTGILYSINGGQSWNSSPSTSSNIFTSVSISSDGTNAVAVSNNELWYSVDGGSSWTNAFTLVGGSFSFVVISRDGMRAIAGGANGLYYSATGGQSWFPTSVSSGFDSASISSNGIKMVAGGVSGIWYSSDGGVTWNQGYSGINVSKVVISGDGKNAVAGGSTGIFGLLYSINSGKTWTQTSKTNNNFPSIVINNDGTKAIAANFDNNEGLWYSECTEQIIPCSTDFVLLNERRKAEILKYKANSSNITKKQQYANAASNRWLTGRKRSWATQTVTYTNPNTSALQRVGNVLVCNNNNVRCTLTSGADVPGKVQPLCYDPTVPLYNYKVTTTYNGGGGKYGLYGRVQVVSLSGFPDITTTFNVPPFDLTPPTSNSPGAFTYTSSNALVATISGNVVTIVGMGTCTITATQAAYSNYTSGSISALLTVNKITPILSNFPSITKTYQTDTTFTLTPPTSTNNPATFTYTSTNTSVATVNPNTGLVAIFGASGPPPSYGVCNITATQAPTPNYTSASISASLTVNRFNTLLTAITITPQNATYQPDTVFSISTLPTSNRTSPPDTSFIYTSSNASVAVIVGTATSGIIVGAGTSTIAATQAETPNYTEGNTPSNPILNVAKSPTTLTGFAIPSPNPKTYGDLPFQLIVPTSDRASDSTPITYSSDNINVATVDSNTGLVTIVAAGSCTFTATQAPTNNYLEGTATSATLVVNGTTSTVFDWNSISAGNQYTFATSPVDYIAGDNLVITYTRTDFTGSDTITGTVAAPISGNSVTLNVSNINITVSPPYTSSPIITTNTPEGSIVGSVVNPTFFFTPATTPPTPELPANSMITGGECYFYSSSTSPPVQMSISIAGTNIQRPTSALFNTHPFQLPTSTSTPYTFPEGCFVSVAQIPQIQTNTGGIGIEWGFPNSGEENDYCGSLSGYILAYGSGQVTKLP